MLLSLPLIAILAGALYLSSIFNQKYNGPDFVFTVKSGETFGRINQRLFNEGLIPNTRFFHYYTKYKNGLTKFRAGPFTISSGSTMSDVLETLIHGKPNLTAITIPEGKNMYEIAKIFANSNIASEQDFLTAAQDPEIIKTLEIEANSLEGYLFPETYKFAPNTPAKSVVIAMVDLFKHKTSDLDLTHSMLNKHQIIILASMVEKETGAKFERPAIAGVFTNRLKKHMRLESDPTTIYGIWSRYQGNLRKSDLLEVTPYNTYKIPALPIGPIANPSLEAIRAVLNPDQHKYLFFVSKNDGTHVFTERYKDHVQAVDDFQRNSKARKGKSWRNLKQN